MSSTNGDPVLWHIPLSHYNEKVRWALDYKGVEHQRKAPPPPAHMAVSMWLTRGSEMTFPLLQFDGRAIADSTAIIAALEEHYPKPALYPEDPADRQRALDLEDFFDEEVGPHTRLLAFHYLREDPEALSEVTDHLLPSALADSAIAKSIARRGGAAFSQMRYSVADEDRAELARTQIYAGFDRLEAELDKGGGGDYLVGDAFSVADLTAASLLGPVVRPPEGPKLPTPPALYQEFCEPFRERRGYAWIEETFARNRGDARRP